MIKASWVFALLAFLIFLNCGVSDPNVNSILNQQLGSSEYSFNSSLKAWNSLKGINGKTYTYQRNNYNPVADSGSYTTIGVEAGEVVSRKYEIYYWNRENDPATQIIEEEYVENASQIGNNLEGYEAINMDDIYHTCRVYLILFDEVNTDADTFTFTTASNGRLTECTYWPVDVQDQSPYSVQITDFKWGL